MLLSMKLKVFTLRLDPARGVFDDTAVEAFLATRAVLDVDQHFFVHERIPTWCLLVRYRELERTEAPLLPSGAAAREDWRSTLAPEHHARSARFTFAQRMDGLALDVLEDLVDARFASASAKREALLRADRRLARLRALVRMSHRRRYLDHAGYETMSRRLEVTGRMLGGWLRQGTAP